MDQVLAWFGAERYASHLERVRRFWRGEGRFMISTASLHGYRQTFDDEKILQAVPVHLQDLAQLPGVNLPSFYPDFGTISTAKYWGGTPTFDSTGGNIFVPHMADTIEDALALQPLPVDDPTMDAAHGLRLYREICERLDTQALWMRTPDFQGALTTAVQVMDQQEFLIAMYTEPEAVHAFLEKICAFLILYGTYLKRESGERICGNIWPDTFLPCEFGMSFTEDLMPLISVEAYQEFGIPCLEKMAQAFGGLHIHCCGAWGRHAPTLKEAGLKILAMECHYPLTSIEEIACLDQTVFIPILLQDQQDRFNGLYDYYRYLIEKTDPSIRYWFTVYGDEEGMRFVREYESALMA